MGGFNPVCNAGVGVFQLTHEKSRGHIVKVKNSMKVGKVKTV